MKKAVVCTGLTLQLFAFTLAAQQTGVQANPGPIDGVGQFSFPAPTPAPAAAKRAEDWNVLSVDPATLQPLSYAVIGTTETADFTRELLRVQWRVADPIDLYVVKPHGVEKPPVVLYLYSYPSDTDRFRDDGWCRRATQDGFAAVGFVSALTGQRYAYRPMREWFVSELQESLGASTHDVQMILNYLARRGDLSVQQVGMLGQGSGGAIAVLAAEADPRIAVLDLLNPWGDWPDWFRTSPQVPDQERAAYLQPEFLKRVANLDPVLYLPHLHLKALRVEQVMDEPITPNDAKQKIGAAVQPPDQLVRYADEKEHMVSWRVTGLSGWIHSQLRPASAATNGQDAPAQAPAARSTPPPDSEMK
jgi:hypothetical protein